MLVADNIRQSEMRVLYGILARAALERFDAPAEPGSGSRDVYFLNLLRLLDMYRYDALRSSPAVGIFESAGIEFDELELEEADQEAVERALKAAHATVRPQASKDEFVIEMKAALEEIFSLGAQKVAQEKIALARAFLMRLSEELKRTQ